MRKAVSPSCERSLGENELFAMKEMEEPVGGEDGTDGQGPTIVQQQQLPAMNNYNKNNENHDVDMTSNVTNEYNTNHRMILVENQSRHSEISPMNTVVSCDNNNITTDPTSVVEERVTRRSTRSQDAKILPSIPAKIVNNTKGPEVKVQENHLRCSYCSGKFPTDILLEHLKICVSNPKLKSSRKRSNSNISSSSSSNNSNKKVAKVVTSIKQDDEKEDEEQSIPPVLKRESEHREEKSRRTTGDKNIPDSMPVLTPAVEIPEPSVIINAPKKHKEIPVTSSASSVHRSRKSSSSRSRQVSGTCPLCKKHFSRARDVKRHVRRSHSEKNFCCTQCPKAFVDAENLERHLATSHVQAIDKLYQCVHCSQFFSKEKILLNHLKSQTCTVGTVTKKKKLPVRNRRVDDAKKQQFVCEICPGRTFPSKNSLSSHMASHSKVGGCTFTCELCRRVFSRQSDKTKHMNCHAKNFQKQLQHSYAVPISGGKGHVWKKLGNPGSESTVNFEPSTEASESDPEVDSDDTPMLRISEVKSLASESQQAAFLSSRQTSIAVDADDDEEEEDEEQEEEDMESSEATTMTTTKEIDDNGGIEFYYSDSPNNQLLESEMMGEEDQDEAETDLIDDEENGVYPCPYCEEHFLSQKLLGAHWKVCSLTANPDSEYVNVFQLLSDPEDETDEDAEEEEEEEDEDEKEIDLRSDVIAKISYY